MTRQDFGLCLVWYARTSQALRLHAVASSTTTTTTPQSWARFFPSRSWPCRASAVSGLSPHHAEIFELAEREAGAPPPPFVYRRIGGG